jgi:hypothetical protein
MTIVLFFRWAKKEGRSRQETTPPTTCDKNNPSKTKTSSGLSPFITDPEVIARREAKKRLLAEQAQRMGVLS